LKIVCQIAKAKNQDKNVIKGNFLNIFIPI
jgi:hypothetical protein